MTPFELIEPASLKEAIASIDPDDPTVRPIAGGTALMLMMKAGVFRPRRLVSLRKIERRLDRHQRRDGRRADHRRDDAAVGGGAFARSRAPRAGDRAHHEAAVERARAQCGDGRRRAGAWRPAHGPAAGADCARRARAHRRARRASARWRSRTCSPAITRPRSAPNELIARCTSRRRARRRAAYCKVTAGSADDWPALGVAVALDRRRRARSNRRAWW